MAWQNMEKVNRMVGDAVSALLGVGRICLL